MPVVRSFVRSFLSCWFLFDLFCRFSVSKKRGKEKEKEKENESTLMSSQRFVFSPIKNIPNVMHAWLVNRNRPLLFLHHRIAIVLLAPMLAREPAPLAAAAVFAAASAGLLPFALPFPFPLVASAACCACSRMDRPSCQPRLAATSSTVMPWSSRETRSGTGQYLSRSRRMSGLPFSTPWKNPLWPRYILLGSARCRSSSSRMSMYIFPVSSCAAGSSCSRRSAFTTGRCSPGALTSAPASVCFLR